MNIPIKYASVCSGIEAPSAAWNSLGWQPQWFSEIEAFPNAVLTNHYPSVANLGDMTKIYDKEIFNDRHIDVLIGGTPCQPFSSAGRSSGLASPLGQLTLEFLRILAVKKATWFIWENVPRVLSINGGRDFGAIIGEVQKLGYGFAWRVLDAQHFGASQRRRRVFLVGHIGDCRPPCEVLLERDSLPGGAQSRHKEGKTSAGNHGNGLTADDLPIFVDTYNFSVTGRVAATLGAHAYNGSGIGPKILDQRGLRTPTPTECEQLMGFPAGYTLIDFPCRNEAALDKLRIRSLGNSMVVPVVRWIGERIARFEAEKSSVTGGSPLHPLSEGTQPKADGDARGNIADERHAATRVPLGVWHPDGRG